MRRRELNLGIGAAGLMQSLGTHAQQTTAPIIGFLHSGSLSGRENQIATFREGLAANGYTEGKT